MAKMTYFTIVGGVVLILSAFLVFMGQDGCNDRLSTDIELPSNNERPPNISPLIYDLYLKFTLDGVTQIVQDEQILDLTALLCSIEVTHKLSSTEEDELKKLGVNIVRYTGNGHHFYIATFSASIVPELAKLEFVKDVRAAWHRPTPEGEDGGLIEG